MALGRAFQHLGQAENASSQYLVALGLAGNSGELREYRFAAGLNMAKLLFEEHKDGQALAILNALTPDYPEYSEVLTSVKVQWMLKNGHNCRMIRLLGLPCENS